MYMLCVDHGYLARYSAASEVYKELQGSACEHVLLLFRCLHAFCSSGT